MGTDPRNGIFQVSPRALGRRRRFLRCLVHGQAAHGGYDVLGRCMLLAGAVFGLFFPETLKGRCGPAAPVGGALSSTLEKTDGGSRLREERLLTDGGGRVTVALKRRRLLTDGGGRVTVALKRREGSAALPSGDAREGSDTPGRREPKECERGRAEVLGTFSARAYRKSHKCGVCDCGVTPLGMGGSDLPLT